MSKESHTDIRRTLLFFRKNNQILLAMKKRGFGAGKWNGVGGKIESGESIEDALVRESIEEVNMRPLSWAKVAELDFIQYAESDPWHMYVHAYISEEWEGDPEESDEMKPHWYDIDTIPYEIMWEDDQYWLPMVLAGDTVSGNFTFDEHDSMVSYSIQQTDF